MFSTIYHPWSENLVFNVDCLVWVAETIFPFSRSAALSIIHLVSHPEPYRRRLHCVPDGWDLCGPMPVALFNAACTYTQSCARKAPCHRARKAPDSNGGMLNRLKRLTENVFTESTTDDTKTAKRGGKGWYLHINLAGPCSAYTHSNTQPHNMIIRPNGPNNNFAKMNLCFKKSILHSRQNDRNYNC